VIEGQSIVYEVSYPYPPERVWQALVDPAELAGWLMPTDHVPVVGARFTMDCDPIGRLDGEVLEVDPPRRLSWRWVAAFGDTIVTFDLLPSGDATVLRMEHRGWSAANTWFRDTFGSGWPGKLRGLSGVLADASSQATARLVE
jgi:uncharacterized protein YndB with AHSA1/START domain